MASRQLLAKYLAIFHELYPTREVSEFTLEAWDIACADMTDPGFGWAADHLIREPGRTFFPTPNEVRAYLPSRGTFTPAVQSLGDGEEDHWSEEAIQRRNARLREENGKLNAEYARRFPAVWGERAFPDATKR